MTPRVIVLALLGGVLVFLGLTILFAPGLERSRDLDALSMAAVAAALASPFVASSLRGDPPLGVPVNPEGVRKLQARALRDALVSGAILDGAATLCGAAYLLNDRWWPLAAALVPLAGLVMLAGHGRSETRGDRRT